jgi:hypothetical protein
LHYFQHILHKKIMPNGLQEIVIEKAALWIMSEVSGYKKEQFYFWT